MEGGHRQALHMSGITDRQRRLGGKKGNRAELRKTEDRPPASCGRRRWDTVFLWKTKDGRCLPEEDEGWTLTSCGRREIAACLSAEDEDRPLPSCGIRSGRM